MGRQWMLSLAGLLAQTGTARCDGAAVLLSRLASARPTAAASLALPDENSLLRGHSARKLHFRFGESLKESFFILFLHMSVKKYPLSAKTGRLSIFLTFFDDFLGPTVYHARDYVTSLMSQT